jgi:hypothetical protein
MIETDTSWSDSGYDCDHCGGEIAKRIDHETGQPDRICYQCRLCGCQWTQDGKALRVGNGPDCRAAQRERVGTRPIEFFLSPRVLIILGILVLLLLARFGSFAAFFALLRFLPVLAILGLIVFYVVRFGREQEWW